MGTGTQMRQNEEPQVLFARESSETGTAICSARNSKTETFPAVPRTHLFAVCRNRSLAAGLPESSEAPMWPRQSLDQELALQALEAGLSFCASQSSSPWCPHTGQSAVALEGRPLCLLRTSCLGQNCTAWIFFPPFASAHCWDRPVSYVHRMRVGLLTRCPPSPSCTFPSP